MQAHARALVALLLAIGLLPLSQTLAQAPQAQPNDASANSEAYQQAVDESLREHQLGNYAEAFAAMRRAHKLSPSARTHRGLAFAAFELRDYPLAIHHMRAALGDWRKPLTPTMRGEMEAVLARALGYVDRVWVTLEPSTATLLLDGRPPPAPDTEGALLLAMGERTLSAQLKGYRPVERSIKVLGGGSHEMQLKLEPVVAPQVAASGATARATAQDTGANAQTLWGIVTLVAAGTFAVGAGIAVGVREVTANKYNDAECTAEMPSDYCRSKEDTVETAETLAIVGGVTAAAVGVTGAVLLLTASDGGAEVRAAIGPGSVALSGRF